MAQFTMTIPNPVLSNVVDALAEDWQEFIPPDNTPNPITKTQHAKNKVAFLIAEYVKNYNRRIAIVALQNPADPGLTVS